MKVSRRRGEVRLRLDAVEVQVLSAVFTELADTLQSDSLGADDPVRQRLFPAAYRDDAAAAAEYRALTEDALSSDRTERARRCAADIEPGVDEAAGSAVSAGVEVHLDADGGTRWITALNDVRLALGTRLGITEDPDDADDETDAPEFQQRALYYWLTGLQDSLVQALMP